MYPDQTVELGSNNFTHTQPAAADLPATEVPAVGVEDVIQLNYCHILFD